MVACATTCRDGRLATPRSASFGRVLRHSWEPGRESFAGASARLDVGPGRCVVAESRPRRAVGDPRTLATASRAARWVLRSCLVSTGASSTLFKRRFPKATLRSAPRNLLGPHRLQRNVQFQRRRLRSLFPRAPTAMTTTDSHGRGRPEVAGLLLSFAAVEWKCWVRAWGSWGVGAAADVRRRARAA